MTMEATPPPVSTMRRDLVSAYLASGMKVFSWALATLMLYQFCGPADFALFALIRGTLSFLNYTTLGLAPAIVHALARAAASTAAAAGGDPVAPAIAHALARGAAEKVPVPGVDPAAIAAARFADGHVLSYQPREAYSPERDPEFASKQVGYSALLLAVLMGVGGCMLAGFYAGSVESIHGIQSKHSTAEDIALYLGIGIALRLASDACGALLQAFGKISADNWGLLLAEGVWIVLMLLVAFFGEMNATIVAATFLMASVALLIYRIVAVPALLGPSRPRRAYFDLSIARSLLWFGVLVSVAQLADYLYAPTDFLLINHLLGLNWVGVYAPAVQIDAGLLLLVGALASVMLPRAAIAHARGNTILIRQYFIRGTVASAAMLLIAAGLVWLMSPLIFQAWLHNPMPATRAILPLILIHTVVGGSSAVGRSILLGMGKVKPFTIAVLIAGVCNVGLSYCFVRFGGMGLNGIVLGTICAVVGRCAVWQPWYVWKCLREN